MVFVIFDKDDHQLNYLLDHQKQLSDRFPKCKIFAVGGVADFGYDYYLLAIASLAVGIAKLLHGQYFRLLDFYFHTLIQ